MSHPVTPKKEPIEWAVAAQPIAGEVVSGDLHLVQPFDHGVLLAAIDGVGHGNEAAAAARMAATILEKHANESVISLVKRCHETLTETRGVVMTLASVSVLKRTVTWLGVGNVEGLLWRARPGASHPCEHVLLRSGLVGYQLPPLQESVMPVMPGDLMILTTDGIRGDFAGNISATEPPHRLAQHILQKHFKGNDDAMVLVARYLGKAA